MTGAAWVVSYVALWVAVLVLAAAVVVLLRQIGILHARLLPTGVHPGGEGPPPGLPAPPVPGLDFGAAPLTLVAFTSPTCALCAALRPSLAALGRAYPEVAVHVVDSAQPTAPVFTAFNVGSTPYIVAVDRAGVVRGGGVANSLEQLEILLEQAKGAA